MKINALSFSEMPETDREEMIQKFKAASPEGKAVMYEQFESLKSENLLVKDREFLQELEADMRAVDFSKWESAD